MHGTAAALYGDMSAWAACQLREVRESQVPRGALRTMRGELRGADDDDLAHAHRRRGAEQLSEVLLLRHVVQHQKRDRPRASLLAKPLRLLLGEHGLSARRARDVLVLLPRARRRLRGSSAAASCADDEGSDASGEGCEHQPLAHVGVGPSGGGERALGEDGEGMQLQVAARWAQVYSEQISELTLILNISPAVR